MGISIGVTAYKRQGGNALPEYQGKLQPWGEIQLGIDDEDAELISIEVEDAEEGNAKNKIKPEELLEALNIIIERQHRRLEQTTKPGHNKLA